MLFAISLQNRRHVFRVVFQTEGEELRACLKTAKKKKKPARSLASCLFTRITEDLKSKRPKTIPVTIPSGIRTRVTRYASSLSHLPLVFNKRPCNFNRVPLDCHIQTRHIIFVKRRNISTFV